MNVLNRIKRLETKLVFTSRFCECFMEYQKKIIDSVYDGTAFDEKAVRLPEGNYCQKCRKPVDVERERTFYETVNLIYGDL